MIRRLGAGVAVGSLLVWLPFAVSSVWQNLLITTFYFGFLGQAWNVLGGYAGQLSLGHAAFFAIGAYTSVVLHTHLGLSPWLGMFVGAVILSVVTTAATGLLLSPDWQFTIKGVVTFIAILAQRFALDKRRQ